jgi:2-methylcitrate dehydratase PrpD
MATLDRRRFLMASGGLPLAAARLRAGDQPPRDGALAAARPDTQPTDVTRRLARYAVTASFADLPAAIRKEARRTLLNYVGCAVGGSRHQTVDLALAALAPFAGQPQARVLGRRERLDVLHAALANGISSHVLDFDDTHPPTIIHASGPVVSALLAYAEYRPPVPGRDFLTALVVGVEVSCRIGKAVYPAHYDAGWHITGTAGVFGAAAAAGRLLGLSEEQMVWALGLAAAQPVGLQEMFGTMTKSFHPGRAAENGLVAALFAARNFTSSAQALEAKYGWTRVLSTARDFGQVTDALGARFEIAVNTYKPFACGIVMHPTIDGCIQLRNEHKLAADGVARVALRVHPLVMQLTGKKAPASGLEGKFSIYHAAAVALVEGAGGVAQFSDRAVHDRAVVALRERVTAEIDRSLHEDQVGITLTLADGRRLERFVEHAVGSVEHPMSDADLESKFLGLAEGVIPAAQARRAIDACWNVEDLADASELARLASVA